jgi:hypothetical protein
MAVRRHRALFLRIEFRVIGFRGMKAHEIRPGEYYRAADIYDGNVIVVRVIGRSESVEDHWICLRGDGSRVLLPTSAFVRRVVGGS